MGSGEGLNSYSRGPPSQRYHPFPYGSTCLGGGFLVASPPLLLRMVTLLTVWWLVERDLFPNPDQNLYRGHYISNPTNALQRKSLKIHTYLCCIVWILPQNGWKFHDPSTSTWRLGSQTPHFPPETNPCTNPNELTPKKQVPSPRIPLKNPRILKV